MSALINKTTLAPGESIGLLDLTGAAPGTLYTILTQSDGLRIVSSPDSESSYPLDSNRVFVTDTEILVKNTTGKKRSVRAVALARGTGGSTGTTAAGEIVLGPGESVGLLDVAGATPGNLYSVSALGDRLGIVSSDEGVVSFALDNNKVYVTNEEILVRNLTDSPDRISVLAIPTTEPSGGGGGGEIPTLDEVLAAGYITDASIQQMTASTASLHSVGSSLYTALAGGGSVLVSQSGITFQADAANPDSGVYIQVNSSQASQEVVTLPSETGTLIVAPPVPTTGTYTLQVVDGVASWVTA